MELEFEVAEDGDMVESVVEEVPDPVLFIEPEFMEPEFMEPLLLAEPEFMVPLLFIEPELDDPELEGALFMEPELEEPEVEDPELEGVAFWSVVVFGFVVASGSVLSPAGRGVAESVVGVTGVV